jgi:chemotaxis signal transduction protein
MGAEPATGAPALPAELQLLLFHAAGAALGVEAAAVEGVMHADLARRSGLACRDLAELLGVAGSGEPHTRLVLVCRGAPWGIGIDELDEIATVPVAQLQPLPAAFPQFPGSPVFWGGLVRASRVVLLVDVDRLLEPLTALAGTAPADEK